MKSWKSSVNGVRFALARSTWSSPSTWRRTTIPWSSLGSLICLQLHSYSLPLVRGHAGSGQRPVDEGVRRTQVPGRVEGRVDLRGGEVRRDLLIGEQLLAQVAPGGGGTFARRIDQVLRPEAADPLGQ